jgi:hypothetical protein
LLSRPLGFLRQSNVLLFIEREFCQRSREILIGIGTFFRGAVAKPRFPVFNVFFIIPRK